MSSLDFLVEYQSFIAGHLRALETKRAKGDPVKIHQISAAPDREVLVKWLWITSIVGGPVCFLALPFLLSLLGPFIWSPVKSLLWLIVDSAMISVFAIFLLALYFTTRKQNV